MSTYSHTVIDPELTGAVKEKKSASPWARSGSEGRGLARSGAPATIGRPEPDRQNEVSYPASSRCADLSAPAFLGGCQFEMADDGGCAIKTGIFIAARRTRTNGMDRTH